jgi:hypothetical protein
MIPFSVLDLSPIPAGSTAATSFRNTLDLARHAERWGYTRYWLAEHHNIPGIASAATSVVIGHVAAGTSRILTDFLRVNAFIDPERDDLRRRWIRIFCTALPALAPSKGSLGRVSIEQASGSNAWVLGSKREAALKRGDRASRRGRGRERRIAPRAVQPSPPCIEYRCHPFP